MKNIILLVLLCGPFSQTFSQDCNTYYFLQDNKTIEMTVYDKKDAVTGKQIYKISDVTTEGNTTTATVESEMFDKKGKSIIKAVNKIQCADGMMMMDMSMNLPQTPQMQNVNATASNIYMEYPASMQVGEQLKDASMQMDIDNNGMKQSIDMQVTNRTVEGKETITTSAGSWECFKISYNTKLKMKTMGIGLPAMNMDNTEWFAPGFGIVKTQSKHGGTAITAIN